MSETLGWGVGNLDPGCLAAEHATVRNEHSTAAVTMASDSVASVGVMDGWIKNDNAEQMNNLYGIS